MQLEDYQKWLDKLKRFWADRDIEKCINLFSDDATYYETPFVLIDGKEKLLAEWEPVKKHSDIVLDFKMLDYVDGDNCVVSWVYTFTSNDQRSSSQGLYYIKLNRSRECYFFIRIKDAEPANSF